MEPKELINRREYRNKYDFDFLNEKLISSSNETYTLPQQISSNNNKYLIKFDFEGIIKFISEDLLDKLKLKIDDTINIATSIKYKYYLSKIDELKKSQSKNLIYNIELILLRLNAINRIKILTKNNNYIIFEILNNEYVDNCIILTISYIKDNEYINYNNNEYLYLYYYKSSISNYKHIETFNKIVLMSIDVVDSTLIHRI